MSGTVSSADLPSGEIWHDETRDFSMSIVRAILRGPEERPGELVRNYRWYPDAVPVDGLLPPGVPMSSTELCAYYPHHVRWQDIMAIFRGAPQDYMNAPVMNQIQRDTVRYVLPDFKTTGYKGNGDANPYTDHLKPGTYLEKKLKGYTIPSFDDLLQGLQHLPSGRDARGLTHCLAWYHDICRTFTPKLQLNVLHTQALIRVLQQPLEPAGSNNLDRLALQEWRDRRMLKRFTIKDAKQSVQHRKNSTKSADSCQKSQTVFNIRKDPIDLTMHVQIPIRHILGFPFPALYGVIGDAFQLGIDNAERRRAARKGVMTPPKDVKKETNWRHDTPQQIGKRPRQAEAVYERLALHTPKRQRVLDDGSGHLVVRTPKRPTVSPITPRTLKFGRTPAQAHMRPIRLESSPLKRE